MTVRQFVKLDSSTIQKLGELGKLTGSDSIEDGDVKSVKGRAIVEGLPILKDPVFGVGRENMDATFLEALRKQSSGKISGPVWVQCLFRSGGVEVEPSTKEDAFVVTLIKDPETAIARMKTDLAATEPVVGAFKSNGGRVVANFSKFLLELVEAEKKMNSKNPDDLIVEIPSRAIWESDVEKIVQAIHLVRQSDDKDAKNFLQQMLKVATPALKMYDGQYPLKPQTGEMPRPVGRLQYSENYYNAVKGLRLIVALASAAIK